MSASRLEAMFLMVLEGHGLPAPEREYKFHPTRKWRFDFVYPDKKIAIEVEGAVWAGGRHTRGAGFENDCEKYGEAVLLGWKVFRFTSLHIKNGYALSVIKRIYEDIEKE